ncbi:hypothetical protein ACLOJK_041435, partial [Asimina triloba]
RPAAVTTVGGATVATAGHRDGTRPTMGHITHRLQSTLHKILLKFWQHLPSNKFLNRSLLGNLSKLIGGRHFQRGRQGSVDRTCYNLLKSGNYRVIDRTL